MQSVLGQVLTAVVAAVVLAEEVAGFQVLPPRPPVRVRLRVRVQELVPGLFASEEAEEAEDEEAVLHDYQGQ